MEKYDLGNYSAEIDRKRTLDWYAESIGWGCECGHCRNFLKLAENKQLPRDIIDILDMLGIPPEKATYVCELFTDESGIHYQFSYRLCGTFVDKENVGPEDVRCCHDPYPYGAPNFPEPHFDLEFYSTLPWVLDDKK